MNSGALFGHLIEDTGTGWVYSDDKTPVDMQHPRPCHGCGLVLPTRIDAELGLHYPDPCLSVLPGTSFACCGHGLERYPGASEPAGYVAMPGLGVLEFSGTCGGERVKAAVDAALNSRPLPEGFSLRQ